MKRILLLIVISSLVGYMSAQDNNWKVYLQGQAVRSIDFENDYVWTATENFLVSLNKMDKSTNYFRFPDNFKDKNCFLKVDKNRVKWIVCSESYSPHENSDVYVCSFHENKWDSVEFYENGPISSFAIDKDNNKWIAGGGMWGHLFKLEQGNFIPFTPENSELLYDNVTEVTTDKNGNVWLANFVIVGDLLKADVSLMKYDGDNWISFWDGKGLAINKLTIDNQGNPWVQNPGVAKKLDTISRSWSEIITLDVDNHLSLRAIDGESKFWYTRRLITKDKGIATYKDSGWNFYTKSNSELPSDTVYQIAIDADGTKWIGTANGLAAFNENGLTTSSNIYRKEIKGIELFPNPANDFIILEISGEIQKSTVNILNIQGEVMKSLTVTENQKRLNISQFPSGIYLVRIQSDKNQILKKFVKQ